MAWARRLPSGRWQGKYLDAMRVEQTVGTFARKDDALDEAREEERMIRRGEWIEPSRAETAFRDFAEAYMRTTVNQDRATAVRDNSLLRNHLLPAFGDVPIAHLSTQAVREWVASLPLAPASVALCYQLLGRMMRQAEETATSSSRPAPRTSSYPRAPALGAPIDGSRSKSSSTLQTASSRAFGASSSSWDTWASVSGRWPASRASASIYYTPRSRSQSRSKRSLAS